MVLNPDLKMTLVVIFLALARVRKVGGSLVVTIPKGVAEEEGVKPGELVNIEVRKTRKSYFGALQGSWTLHQQG